MSEGRSLTRSELDDIIRRATELAASEADSSEAGGLTEAEVLRIGKEVGLSERHVRLALVESRVARPSEESKGLMVRTFGPKAIRAARIVTGDEQELRAIIDRFMVSGRLLQPVRSGPTLLLYRPAVDWASQIARFASSTSRKYFIASAKSVEVHLTKHDDDECMVELEVEPGTREDHVIGGLIAALFSGVGVGVGAGFGLGVIAPLGMAIVAGSALGAGVAGMVGWIAGRHHKKRLVEVRAEMEGVLDRLEMKEDPEPPPPSWRRWVRRHFHGVARDVLGEESDEDM